MKSSENPAGRLGTPADQAWLHIECVPGTLMSHVAETGFLIFGPKLEFDGNLAIALGSPRKELSLDVADNSVVVVSVIPGDDAEKAVAGIADQLMHRHTLSSSEAARKLGTTVAQVRGRCSRGQLSGYRQGRLWRYPSWQFTDDGVLPGLKHVLRELPPAHPLVIHLHMTTSNEALRLGGRAVSPRTWLQGGGSFETLLRSLNQPSRESPWMMPSLHGGEGSDDI